MTNRQLLAIVQRQLAIDLNCTVDDLNGPKDSFIFVEAHDNPGRIPYRRNRQHFDMLTMGQAIIASATPARLRYVREQLAGTSRDEAFELPFICGHSLWYLPDLDRWPGLPALDGFLYRLIEGEAIANLPASERFRNAVQQDGSHPIQNTLVLVASQPAGAVGMAGAFALSPQIWAIGIDVLPENRAQGLAAYLVNRLAGEILRRGIAPCYGTSSSNIASQRVAHRAGFMPAWMCDHKTRFEGELRNS